MRNYGYTLFTLLLFSICTNAIAENRGELSVPRTKEDPAWSKSPARLQAAWADTDYLVDKFSCPSATNQKGTQTLVAWRGERVHAKLLVMKQLKRLTLVSLATLKLLV